MQVVVANTSFQTVAVIDDFESLLWTDRYNEAGDFELYLSAHSPALKYLQQDFYCFIKESDRVMIIEGIEIKSDSENGDKAIVTGRSLESILERRIIWTQTTFKKNKEVQTVIKSLINKNVISPSANARKIPNFIFKDSEDANVKQKLPTAIQFTGDNLYDVIRQICEAYEIGFMITLDKDSNFVFELYSGANRTYDQLDNPYVIFSPRFDNIVNSDYLESKKTLKNVTLVAGEGEGKDRKTRTVYIGSTAPSGLDRRELYTDARDLSSNTTNEEGEDETLSATEYNELLDERGKEKLAENVSIQTFDGQVESSVLFIYGRDFFMGDIIQIENEFGISGTARITEFIRSQDVDGIEMYPTFKAIN